MTMRVVLIINKSSLEAIETKRPNGPNQIKDNPVSQPAQKATLIITIL